MLINEKYSFQDSLLEHAKNTEDWIRLQIQDFEQTKNIPLRLLQAMKYALLGPGKRLRPFLVCESARLFGGLSSGVLSVAAAVEYAHTYSLIHDDLPSMDNDDLRRGQPTVHKAFDEATAILAGDALLTEAFELISGSYTHENPDIRLRLISAFSRSLGVRGMVGGQMYDLLAEQRYGEHSLTLETMERVQMMKTGALFAFSAQAGAIFYNQPESICRALEAYGYAMGIAFQIRDDLLDMGMKDSETEIKNTVMQKSPSFSAFMAKEKMEYLLNDYIARALESLSPFGERAALLRDAAYFAGQRAL